MPVLCHGGVDLDLMLIRQRFGEGPSRKTEHVGGSISTGVNNSYGRFPGLVIHHMSIDDTLLYNDTKGLPYRSQFFDRSSKVRPFYSMDVSERFQAFR